MFNDTTMMLFAGNSNPELAKSIAAHLQVSIGKATVGRFSDGEVKLEILENIRGRDVFLIQPTCPPGHENLMELLVMADACQRASAARITALISYFGFARQDRRPRASRVPITAKLVAKLIASAGIDRVLTVDLHADQIQGFFDIAVDNVYASPVLLDDINRQRYQDLIVVSPDIGGVVRARALAKRLEIDLAIIDKRRVAENEAEVMHIVGDVKGKNVIIIDDMIDTAGTLVRATEALVREGARRIFTAATHAVLSGPAVQRINESAFESVLVTNTILLPEEKCLPKIKVVSVAGLLGEAVKSIHEETSVSKLFV